MGGVVLQLQPRVQIALWVKCLLSNSASRTRPLNGSRYSLVKLTCRCLSSKAAAMYRLACGKDLGLSLSSSSLGLFSNCNPGFKSHFRLNVCIVLFIELCSRWCEAVFCPC